MIVTIVLYQREMMDEVSDEYMQIEMTKGLLETLEEAKKSGKELMDLKTQYRQLYEAITSSLPEKIELSKTSLNEAVRQFYGIDVSEFLDEVEIIESNVAGPSDLRQQGLQQQCLHQKKPDEDIDLYDALYRALSHDDLFSGLPKFDKEYKDDTERPLYDCRDYSVLDEAYIHTCKGINCKGGNWAHYDNHDWEPVPIEGYTGKELIQIKMILQIRVRAILQLDNI